MTIDEAIAHEREVETIHRNNNKLNETLGANSPYYNTDCLKCAEEHEQLAEWLEELKAFQENKWTDIYIKRGYNKAIDDFVNQFNVIVDEKCGTDTNNYFRKIVKEVAEQLKESETE